MLACVLPATADPGPGPGPSVDITVLDPYNLISVGDRDAFATRMDNTGEPGVPQDVLYNITLTAVVSNSLVEVMGVANVTVYRSDATLKWAGGVSGTTETIIYAPWSLTESFSAVTWTLPETVNLEGREYLIIGVGLRCLGEGTTLIHIFPRSTEDHHTGGQPLGSISDQRNLYQYTDGLWYPLHNSYDPYDTAINNGHIWDQHSWNPSETTSAYAKGEKHVTQESPPPAVGGIEIPWPTSEQNSLAQWASLTLVTVALIAVSVKIWKIEK